MEAKTRATLNALIAIVFFTYIGQNLLNTSLAPVGRQMHLPEWVLGATVSAAAVMVASLSQRWGRLSQSWGRRPVLLSSLSLACIAGYLFAGTAWAASAGYISPQIAAIGVLAARGFFFGAAIAAVPPTGQALIAAITPGQQERIRGMALFGSSINASIMIGSLLSAVLATITLMLPVYTTPVMVTIALVIAFFAIPRTPRPEATQQPPRLRVSDRRILPFLVCGFGLFFTLGTIQILIGFIVQDRYGLPPNRVVAYTGLIMLAQAALALLTQAVLVPRLPLGPLTLMRCGLLIGLTGLVIAALPTSNVWWLALATALFGTGLGLFSPGYNAGASLAVGAAEQGGVAGLLNATNASTWVIAPILSTTIYAWSHLAPFLIAGALLVCSTLVAWMPRRIRRILQTGIHQSTMEETSH